MLVRRALIRGLTVMMALTAVTAVATQSAGAAGGPSVNAPDISSVSVSNSSMSSRGPDEATTRSLKGDQPAGGSQEGGGSFTATPFSASASWEVSKQSGDFTWSYPLRVPPSPGGFAPSLGLSYRSSAVDGLTSATNNQPSWVGDGWDLSVGFIERAYGGCAGDTDGGTTPPKTGDLCWRSDNATASYAGGGGMLIKDDATGTWRLKSDDRSRVERVIGAGNGDNDGESWKITTVDGTQYFFGSRPEAKSTWTVPVFGDDAGEPCHGTSFDSSSCAQAWRWMLDKVVDPRGNMIQYSYETETNNYGKNMKDAAASYVRAGSLKLVEYGLHTGVAGQATGRVEFGLENRCVKESNCSLDVKENWPDAAVSERCVTDTCKDKHAPTFWSTKRLSTITTQVLRGSSYANVDRWTLQHEFPKGDDVYQAALWLKGVTHTGLVGGEAATPAVTFEGTAMPNRVDTPTGIGPLNRYRVTGVVSEAGGITTVKYAPPNCVPGGSMPANAESNTLRCYPVTWAPEDHAERTDHFHKYVVESITSSDRLASSAEQVVSYEYLDGAAWRYDRSEFAKDDKRTWNEFRGYGRVRAKTGVENDPGGPVTVSEERFYRGMHGDKLPNNGTRSVNVTDSEGGAREDSDWLQGQQFESQTRNGTGEGVVSKKISTPVWAGPTATRGAHKAYWVATGSSSEYTMLRSGGWRVTRTETKYDDHGQVTETNDLGDIGTAADDRCSRTSHEQNAERWMWSYPAETETVSVHCAAQAVFPDQALSGVRNGYDDNGNVTKVDVLDKRPASGAVWTTNVTTEYDSYGRSLKSTDALGNTATTAYTPATGGPLTKTVVTDPLGNATTTEFDPAWGTATKVADANENTTEAQLDPMGRVVRVWKPNRPREDFPDKPTVSVAYDVQRDAPTSVTATVLNAQGGYTTSTEVYDGHYRVRQSQTPTNGGRLVVDTKYDSQGRAFRATQPFFNNQPVDKKLLVFSETEVPGLTREEFDAAGRPKASIFQGGGQEKWRSTTEYGGDRVDKTPPQGGTATTTISDARGQLTELWQYKSGTPSGDHETTRYTYTTAGKLASTVDGAGNTWRWSYDLRGRPVRSEDVDKGVSTTTYDGLNRVETVTDARGKTLTYSYDALSRKTAVKSGATVLQDFKYDTAEYGKGMLASSTRYVDGHAYVSRVTRYTSLYQPTQTEVEIPAVEGPLKGTYKVNYTYKPDGSLYGETFGAVAAANLPVEAVTHEYDEFGRPLKTSAGFVGSGTDTLVNNTQYTRLGELYRLELGTTGKRTWLSYYYDDNTRRMNRYIVDAEVASPMQADVNYSYDPVGNITSIADTTQGKPADRQCFRYDHLRRLTEAWTPSGECSGTPSLGTFGPAPYWHSYTYDQIGNRLTEVQHSGAGDTTRTYAYPATGSPRPHAVSSVTTAGPDGNRVDEFSYDAIGGTATRKVDGADQQLDWDVEGRVTKVTEGTKVTEFLYGADGARLIRRDPQATTLYVANQEIRLAKGATAPTVCRYYQHGGKVVAMREGKSKLTWLSSDVQGTSQVAVDRSTMQVQQRRQLPFGGPRGSAMAFPGERGFVGGTNDASTGLVDIGARQYDPALGKFISVDPIMDAVDPQQWNAYAYANNSPITFSDPTGLAYCDYNVCAGDPGYNPVGPRNNKDGQCVHNCHNSHNNYTNGSDAPGGKPQSKPAQKCYTGSYPAMGPCGGGGAKQVSSYPACGTGCSNPSSPEKVHMILDLLGMIPLIGEPVDALHCAVYAAEGAAGDAALTCASVVPLFGGIATAAKWAKNGDNAGDVLKCVNSFSGDTLVLMADGSTKRIDEIEPGDEVAASQPGSETPEERDVLLVHVTDADKEYVDLTVATPEGPKTIRTTAHHRFYNATTQEWEDAEDLEAGEELSTPGNGRASVAANHAYRASMRTYNLSVDTVNTFYVLAGSTAVLVHNCGTLAKDNGVAGGHVIDEHVGKSDQYLINRAAREGGPASSLDPATAQNTIDQALADVDVSKWAAGAAVGELRPLRPKRLDYVIGRVADANGNVVDANTIVVVLKRIKKGTDGHKGAWIVHTVKASRT